MKIRYIHFSPDEWITGCVGLENAERGLYITACAMIYSHGGPIPLPELKVGCRDHGHAFNRQLKILLGLGKLSLNDGQISNKRCVNELQKLDKWEANRQQKPGKSPTNDPQNNPQSPKTNGLDAPHARAHTHAPAPRITNHRLELSDPMQIRESSNLARLRAREIAQVEGASRSSAATNHKSSRSEPGAPPWEQRCRHWAESGFWNAMWGPPPSEADCNAPADLVAEARKARNGHDASPPPRTPEDIVAVDALVKETLAAIKRKAANANGPNLQLDELDAWVGLNLDGDERTLARKAIEETRIAGDDTPSDIRKLVDAMDELRRGQTRPSAAC